MNGPTPVSSLIHTSTLVTAGIFLLIKLSSLIQLTLTIINLSLIIGTITTILAGTMAIVSKDIKEIIANSTISQLAYLLIACGLSHYSASLFHLLIHGCFKACLFLSAGIIIHAIKDEQDIRLSSQLAKHLPLTFTIFLIASLSLTGFPFTSGFYSKDLIIELASLNFNSNRYAFILS
jgi:NADH:ubiquinone oxidoreductase subunit 5 (subunit L)/multisubunit Na+/H+ antiporter MnhA subunit